MGGSHSHSTEAPPPPQAAPVSLQLGACKASWYLGGRGQDCGVVCGAHGPTCHLHLLPTPNSPLEKAWLPPCLGPQSALQVGFPGKLTLRCSLARGRLLRSTLGTNT